jgi:hypothetical protein
MIGCHFCATVGNIVINTVITEQDIEPIVSFVRLLGVRIAWRTFPRLKSLGPIVVVT